MKTKETVQLQVPVLHVGGHHLVAAQQAQAEVAQARVREGAERQAAADEVPAHRGRRRGGAIRRHVRRRRDPPRHRLPFCQRELTGPHTPDQVLQRRVNSDLQR